MTFDEFSHHVSAHRPTQGKTLVVPIVRRLSADLLTPVSAFLKSREPGTYSFLLESVEGGERLARYSFIGKRPYQVVEARGKQTTLVRYTSDGKEDSRSELEGGFFAAMQEILDRYEEVVLPDLPRLRGGAVGFVSYDAVRLLEHIDADGAELAETGYPDALFCFYSSILAFDHVRHQIILISNAMLNGGDSVEGAYDEATQNLERMEETILNGTFDRPKRISLKSDQLTSNMSRDQFEKAVVEAKHHIFEGDALQIVLSHRFETTFEGDEFNLYRALRQVNPSPYLYYLDFRSFSVVGSSPELLVRAEDGRAELLPIAGTRPRGATPEEDQRLEDDLLADSKERAEHAMLVDLGRNDLGRVSQMDSVRVDRYAFVERYSHVMHIVSSVSGSLREGQKSMNVLAACFPAGTVSGAPKVAAMRIIEGLELERRGIYAGAVGYVDFSGNMDTCIAIRTMIVDDRTIWIQAGAGIVADSDPAREYDETVNKARALREAIRVAAEELI
jgi:anthranilate synthase component 1